MISDQIKITDIGSHIQVSWPDAVITTHRKTDGAFNSELMNQIKEAIEAAIKAD